VKYMSNMFYYATNFNQNITGWNVANVIQMDYMFCYASSFNQSIGTWNVASVTTMTTMFGGAISFNQKLGAWNISKVTSMGNFMFYNVPFTSENYNDLLIGWGSLSSVQNGITLNFGTIKYNSGAAASGRLHLTQFHNWIIRDGGENVDTNSFYSIWNTTKISAGSSNADQIRLPLIPEGTYDFIVYWGDGSSNHIVTANYTSAIHTYPVAGEYSIFISGEINGWSFSGQGDCLKIINIMQWSILKLGNIGRYFSGCSNLQISATLPLDLTSTTNLSYTFAGCSAINIIPGINNWEMSNIINMSAMFLGVINFSSDISNWNIINVLDMTGMFTGVTLSMENYDSILYHWSTLPLQSNVVFNAGNSQYSTSMAPIRNYIISNYFWTIIDGGDILKNFTTRWDTSKISSGSSNSTQIQLPLIASGLYNFTVYWGDGTFSEVTSWDDPDKIHNYSISGMYNITVRGTIIGWQFNNGGDRLKLIQILQWGDLNLGNSGSYFYGCSNLVNITATDTLNLTDTTNLNSIFRSCSSLKLINGLNGWVLSNVLDLSFMFANATQFNQDISNWNVSRVTSVAYMFYNAYIFNQPIGNWDMSQVMNMSYMFYYDRMFNQAIGNWDVSRVTTMAYMFHSATGFNQNIGSWNLSSLTNMGYMFYNATQFNQPIGNWNVSQVTDMTFLFYRTSVFNQDIGNWDVSKVVSMNYLFSGAVVFNQDLGRWNVSRVTSMTAMFDSAREFNQNLSQWDVSNVINMEYMFYYASKFNGNISNWNVSKVTSMRQMFYQATVFNHPIGAWNISKVVYTMSMFSYAYAFNQPIGNWDISSVWSMSSMFYNAISFNQNLGKWNMKNVNDVSNMFFGVTLSTSNYDALLIGWASLLSLKLALSFNGGSSRYSSGEAAAARYYLTNNRYWSISDGGQILNVTNYFTTYWNTSIISVGSSTSTQIQLPLVPTGIYNFTVYWGDGKYDIITDWNNSSKTHSYGSAGTYYIQIKGLINGWSFNGAGDCLKILCILNWNNFQLGNIGSYFAGCTNLQINASDLINLTETTNMSYAFANCSSIVSINGLNNWNMMNITDMSFMFSGAILFNQLLDLWNVSSVQNMSNMFNSATNFDQNIGSWNISNVMDMSNMFFSVTLTIENYDALLIGWASLVSLQSNVQFDVGDSKNSDASAEALATLIALGWTITDGNGSHP
jgi:surface protein